jgi:hypothetical protein
MKKFRYEWHTHSHVDHPFGDLIWHLFWGIVIGFFLINAIISKSYWLLISSLMALVLFFHPTFYHPTTTSVIITEEGIEVDGKFYPWNKFAGFEIFKSPHRYYIFLVPKRKFGLGLHVPIDSEKVDIEKLREDLNYYLDEYQNAITFFDKIYRGLFP